MNCIRATVLAVAALIAAYGPAVAQSQPDPRDTARQAVEAADNREWPTARLLAAKAGDPLIEKYVTWLEFQDSDAVAAFGPVARFLTQNPGWPRATTLRRTAERAILPTDDASAVAAFFDANPPLTGRGALFRLDALSRLGRAAEVARLAPAHWIELGFDPSEEALYLAANGRHIGREDHAARLDRLLKDDSWSAAQRMLPRVAPDIAKLAEARIALMRMQPGVDGAIARVPPALRDAPELQFERLRWRRRQDRDADARELVFAAPSDIGMPERWAFEARILARRALYEGLYSEAARLAAAHRLDEGVHFAEGEFLAGWVQLSFLRQADSAYRHFETLYNGVGYPISLARGAYWAGRAAAQRGDATQAANWYSRAAMHPTTFYGQRALEALDKPIGSFGFVAPQDPNLRTQFEARELVQLVRHLHAIGAKGHLRGLLLNLAIDAQTEQERLLVARLAQDVERPREAIYAAKRANQLDHVNAEAGYPLVPLPPGAGPAVPEDALVLALIHQESGFDREAVSPASARGMMQLLPSTAELVARKQGMGYEPARLTGDADYNIRLGRAYLQELLDRFAGSRPLALAAYNAGPNRVDRWLRENGDPRGRSTAEMIDWIESIPFPETRDYVQRVLENVPVYRFLLSGQAETPRLASPGGT